MSKEEAKANMLNEEVTLKELILKALEYLNYILKNWWVLALTCLFTTSFFLYRHFAHVPTYTAELRFVVEGQGSVSGGLGGLLGSMGIKKGGSVNPYKVIEVGKSSKLFEDIAFSSYDSDTTIIEKIIKEYDLVRKWSENNKKYNDFHFLNDKMERPIERRIFKTIKGMVWASPENEKDALSKLSLDDKKGIYTLSTSTIDENLSIVMTNSFYQGIKAFFEDEIFENQKRSAEILAIKADSINNLKNDKVYQLARFEDRNKNLLHKVDQSKRAILTQEIQALGMAYGELIKNYEMTDVNLKDLQPLFMEIDRPFSPLRPNGSSLIRNLIKGLLLGLFLGSVLIIGHRIYYEVML